MSSSLFVHYPEFFPKELRSQCDTAIRRNLTLGAYAERVDINTPPHYEKILARISPMRQAASFRKYALYAALYLLARAALPPSYREYRRRPQFQEDRAKMRYNFALIDICGAGVFVLSKNRKLAFNAYQNAKRLFQQGKPVWVMTPANDDRWVLKKLDGISRALRMSREDTFMRLCEFTPEPRAPLLEALGLRKDRE